MHAFKPVETLVGRRQKNTTRQVKSDRLLRQFLNLVVQLNSVLLQLGYIGVAVDGMHATCRVPG